jgi:sodium transport system permease protein
MVAIGALARSFKEAQTLLTPVYFLCMAPSLLAALGDFELRGAAAFIPGIGVTLLARDIISGHASIGAIVAVLVSSVGYGAAALALACRLYDSERLLGADEATLGLRAWLRHLLLGPRAARPDETDAPPTAGQAIALFGFAVLVLFAFAPLQAWRLAPGLALFEWVGLLGLTAVFARGSGRRFTTLLRLRRPSLTAVAGALLIGCSAWIVLAVVVQLIQPPPPKELEEHLRRLIPMGEGRGGLPLALLLVAVTPAVCEEALFRGPILRGLRTRFSAFGAVMLTGVLFGIYHADVWKIIPTALLGVALSAIALAADSIVPAMLAHFANNACLVVLASSGADLDALSPKVQLGVAALAATVVAAGAALMVRAHRMRLGGTPGSVDAPGGQM